MSRHHRLNLFIAAAVLAALACEQRPIDLAPTSAHVEWEHLHRFEESANASKIWVNSSSDIYVAYRGIPEGQTSQLLRFDGLTWTSIDMPANAGEIRDIWSPGSGDLYVSTQSIWRLSGSAWSQMPVASGQLAGTNDGEVYVAGRDYVTRFNGSTWDSILATPVFPRAIYAFPGPDVFVAREDSILRWNGSAWSGHTAVGLIQDMWGVDSDDLYAVGRTFNGTGAVWHWNGVIWTSQQVPSGLEWLVSISGSSSNEAIATGGFWGSILRLEGGVWHKITDVPTSRYILDVSFVDPDDWVAVGEQDKVIRQSGSAWSTLRDAGPVSAGVAWMDSPDFIVVAEGRYLSSGNAFYHFESGAWHEDPASAVNPMAMDGSSRDNIYMTTYEKSVLRFDGAQWVSATDSMLTTQDAVSVAPDGGIFTVGEGSSYRFDGNTWELTYNGARRLLQVWARNRNEAYAISYETVMAFIDGSWRVIYNDPDEYFQAVWGTTTGEVYVGSSEGVYQYDGGVFERVSPRWDAEAISGTSNQDILAANQSFFFVYDGSLWSPAEQSFGYSPRLNSSGQGGVFLLQHYSSHISQYDDLLLRKH